MPRSASNCASTWKGAAARCTSCCPTPPSSRSASCSSKASWARSWVAIRPGRATSPPRSGRRMSTVKCVLHETQMPLKRVMRLEIGDTLMFDARPDSVVSLRCGDFVRHRRSHRARRRQDRRPGRQARSGAPRPRSWPSTSAGQPVSALGPEHGDDAMTINLIADALVAMPPRRHHHHLLVPVQAGSSASRPTKARDAPDRSAH